MRALALSTGKYILPVFFAGRLSYSFYLFQFAKGSGKLAANLSQLDISCNDRARYLILFCAVIPPLTEITIQNLQMDRKIPARIIGEPVRTRLPLSYRITITKNQDQSDVGYMPVQKK
jgi:hypothetical protein